MIIFLRYPFLCPNLFGAVFALLMLLLVVLFLPETRFFDEQRHPQQEANRCSLGPSELSDLSLDEKSATPYRAPLTLHTSNK